MNYRILLSMFFIVLSSGCNKSSDSYASYDDCILSNIRSTSNTSAIYAIQTSCKQKFRKQFDFDELAESVKAPKWRDVLAKDDYKKLTPQEKNEAKKYYLIRYIFNNTHPDFKEDVEMQFDIFDYSLQSQIEVSNIPVIRDAHDTTASAEINTTVKDKLLEEYETPAVSNQGQVERQNDLSEFFKDKTTSTGKLNQALSTFTVDNTTGQHDAFVKLYLNGKKPAVRSFAVKLGESFTSKGLPPGIYVMRYKSSNSDDVFEMEGSFVAKQEKTEFGVSYSNFTVTLFRTRDGNMKSKKVGPESF